MQAAKMKRESVWGKLQPRWLALCFLLVLCGLYLFHGRAIGSYLRHTRVAEGNISHAVHAIWSRGAAGYMDVLRSDAVTWGRIRPVHWLYHSLPFFATMLRNGDFLQEDADTGRSERMNGDLQMHTNYLLLSIAIAIFFIGWLGAKTSGSRWFAFIFLLLFLAGPRYLNDNLKVNFCDSQEIGQLLFISLYLYCIADIFKLKRPGAWQETIGTLFLVLAYGMKETTIVLSPIVAGFLLWKLLADKENADSTFRSFVCRHIAVHSALALALLSVVYIFKSGAYVSENYSAASNLHGNLSNSWRSMMLYTQFIRYLIVTAIGLLACFPFVRRKRRLPLNSNFGTLNLLLVSFGIMAGFWAINIPWKLQLAKYYLPAFYFLSLCCASICIESTRFLKRLGFKPAAIVWFCGSILFLTGDIASARKSSRGFYRNKYEYRKTIPRTVEDMASANAEKDILRMHLIAGTLFQERELTFCRMLNHAYKKNIACDEEVVNHIDACERNYFRIYPGAQAYEIDMSSELPESLEADYVYVWSGILANEKKQMEQKGYELIREWCAGNPGTRVGVYVKK
jgi:hypothetical protein